VSKPNGKPGEGLVMHIATFLTDKEGVPIRYELKCDGFDATGKSFVRGYTTDGIYIMVPIHVIAQIFKDYPIVPEKESPLKLLPEKKLHVVH